MSSIPKEQASERVWVRESRFGRWFLSTDIWFEYVLREAIIGFKQLLKTSLSGTPQILDVGCGQGLAFRPLEQYFQPKGIVGVDIDKEQFNLAPEMAKQCKCEVKFVNGTVYKLNISDSSIDMIFCHQLFHHLSDQSRALEELYRVLVPGGIMLSGESCRSFLDSLWVRLLFRHPTQIQKSAEEYVEFFRSFGFTINDHEIKTSRPWWSRKDFGLTEKIGLTQKPQEATEVLMIARKPCLEN